MVELNVGAAGAGCPPVLNEEHSMIVSADGGGTTYETLSYVGTDRGDTVV